MKNQITKADFRLQNEVTMFEKMTFQNQDEKDDFEKYRCLKGDDLYYQIYRILLEKSAEVRYVQIRAYIRYDKNLRDKLYIYLATLEEYCKAQLLRFYDVKTSKKYERHCYDIIVSAVLNTKGKRIISNNINRTKPVLLSMAKSWHHVEKTGGQQYAWCNLR